MRFFRYISILVSILLIGFCIYQNAPHYQIINGKIFGTYYNIKIRTDKKDNQIAEKIKNRLSEINQEMSVFEENSEISRLNRLQKNKKAALSEDMSRVLIAADTVYRQSGGWFDPTLGKLVDVWGFGAGKKQEPSEQEIRRIIKSAGFNKLKFAKKFQEVKKTDSETFLNLSAIAKGYGVDEVAKVLDVSGYENYIVEIGGEVKARGSRSKSGEAWNVGLNKPLKQSSENVLVISLSNLAVATSGNYRNFYQKDGKTYVHTISFKTGRPVLNDALSVSVFHDSCMYADAYATAVMAMGVEKGIKFADRYQLKVIIIDNNFQMRFSQAARPMFAE